MKKSFRRALAMLLASLMLVSALPVYAAGDEESLPNPQDAVTAVLQGMAQEPEIYKLENVDFLKLQMGYKIPAYEVSFSGIIPLDNIEYYPIYEEDSIVAIATVTYTEEGIPVSTVSSSLAGDFSDYSGKEIALIFDNEAMYIWNENSCNLVTKFSSIDSRMSILSADQLKIERTVFGAMMKPQNKLLIHDMPTSRDTQRYLSVPSVKQPTTLSCWAACIKSIAGYYGVSRTIDQIYSIAGITKYSGASIVTAGSVLENSPFSFSVTNAFAGATSCLAFDSLQYYINCGYPLYGAVVYTSNSGHAVVVRGYYNYTNSTSYAGSISYMNPATGNYEASNVASRGSRPYVYTDSSGAVLGNIVDFLIVAN